MNHSTFIHKSLIPAACFLLLVPAARAQVTTDASRPFGLGQVVTLPGTSDYEGDLPHEIQVVPAPAPYQPLGGWLEIEAGWLAPPGAQGYGLHANPPAVLFDEVAYPFPSSSLLGWLPAAASFEALNFPAEAWWGPRAAAGALQLRPSALPGPRRWDLSAWGGSPWEAGARAGFRSPDFAAVGDYLHRTETSDATGGAFLAESLVRWVPEGPARLESGFLGAQGSPGNDWYSAYTNLDLSLQDFQTLRLKPYFQTASLDGRRINEVGGRMDYLFNMAGLVESHFGVGVSRDDQGPAPGSGAAQRGYFQNMELFDVLGTLSVDTAFRWDFSSLSPEVFSALVGVQYHRDPWTFLGDYAKGRLEEAGTDLRQMTAGVRLLPGEEWDLTGKYIRQEGLDGTWNGGQLELRVDRRSLLADAVGRLRLEARERVLASAGRTLVDSGARVGFRVFRRVELWTQARCLTGTPFYVQAGAEVVLDAASRVFLMGSNLSGAPVSWPDPGGPSGRVFRAGLETGF